MKEKIITLDHLSIKNQLANIFIKNLDTCNLKSWIVS